MWTAQPICFGCAPKNMTAAVMAGSKRTRFFCLRCSARLCLKNLNGWKCGMLMSGALALYAHSVRGKKWRQRPQ